MRCAVYGCTSNNKRKDLMKDIKFFSFPKDRELQGIWKHLCKRQDSFNVKTGRICLKHFSENDIERNEKHELLGYSPEKYRPLKKDAVPSRNLPTNPTNKEKSNSGRAKRQEQRQQQIIVKNILKRVDDIDSIENRSSTCSGGVGTLATFTNTIRNIGVNTEADNRDQIILELQQKIEVLEKRQKVIGKLFSEEQLKKLEQSKKRIRWSMEDISKGIVIHSAGPRAYRLLLKKGYPFPAESSLRSWLKKIKIAPEILKDVFKFMKFSDMSSLDKVYVLSFDEMKIKKAYLYDKVNDETLKPYSYVQVVMLRGLFTSWKQPVFYDYDFQLTKEKLFEIIRFAESSGFQVVAMVSDLGGGNRGLHKKLNITYTNTSFKNPVNKQNVYVFANVLHLIKLTRNHFVDERFILNGQHEINKSIIEELIDVTGTSDLKMTHKISKESLNVTGSMRQKVKLATKLFSYTISRAISRCGTMDLIKHHNWLECAEFFKLVNDWFDIMNVREYSSDTRARTKAYGLALEIQNGIILDMTDTIKKLRVKGKKSLLPFQKGIIMTNTFLLLLYEDLKKKISY